MPAGRLAARVGASVFLFYLAFLPPGIMSSDGQSMLAVSESLLDNHSFAVPANRGLVGRDGRSYSMHYPLLSVVALPAVAVAHGMAQARHLDANQVAAATAPAVNAMLTAVTAALLVLFALALGATAPAATIIAFSYALGTIALPHARTFFADPLLALIVTAGLLLAITRAKRAAPMCGLLAVLAVLAKPSGVILGPVLGLYFWLATRRASAAIPPVAGTVLGGLLYLGYNVLRFGDVLSFGVTPLSTPGSGFSLVGAMTGMAGLLISPGRGLLWYSPVAILGLLALTALRRDRQPELVAIVLLFGGFLLLHGSWRGWDTAQWGPRFLLPAIPAVMAALGSRRNRLVMALAAVGFVINAPTLLAPYERYYMETQERGTPAGTSPWSMSLSPALHMWPAAMRQVRVARTRDVRDVVRHAGTDDATVAGSQHLQVVSLWWWMLPAVGVPMLAGITVALALLIGASGMAWQATRLARCEVAAPDASAFAIPERGAGSV